MRTFSFGALSRLLASSMIGDRRRFLHTHLTMDFALTGLVGLADAGCGTHQRRGCGTDGWAAVTNRRIGTTGLADGLEDYGDALGQRTCWKCDAIAERSRYRDGRHWRRQSRLVMIAQQQTLVSPRGPGTSRRWFRLLSSLAGWTPPPRLMTARIGV